MIRSLFSLVGLMQDLKLAILVMMETSADGIRDRVKAVFEAVSNIGFNPLSGTHSIDSK